MAKRVVHHMDFDALVGVNRQVVALTREPHEYSPADGKKLEEVVSEVEARANIQDFEEAIPDKASLLIFRVASGQYFRAGNMRTALVAGQCFLKKNGYKLDIRNRKFVSTVDKVGVAAASLDDLFRVVTSLMGKIPVDRKGWEKATTEVVEANRRFLTDLAS